MGVPRFQVSRDSFFLFLLGAAGGKPSIHTVLIIYSSYFQFLKQIFGFDYAKIKLTRILWLQDYFKL